MFSLNIFKGSTVIKVLLFLITICLIYISFSITFISPENPVVSLKNDGLNSLNNSAKGIEFQNVNSDPIMNNELNDTDEVKNDKKDEEEKKKEEEKKEEEEKKVEEEKPKARDEILYVSRHDGTISNFKYIADKLGYDTYNLRPQYDFDKRPKCLDNGECSNYVTAVCRKYKYIVISDIIPDSFPYLVSECEANVVLEITNRYDIFVPQEEYTDYLTNVGKAIIEKKNVRVVANNPYESYYACKTGVHIPKHYIIRPAGVAPPEVLNKQITEKHEEVAVVDRTRQDNEISKIELDKRNVNFKMLEWHYGGPLVLASYKAMVFLPYQVSVMKMMENFRYGVAMMIPSEELFKELIKNDNYDFADKDLANIPNGLKEYTEWYNDVFKDLFVYFDSWDDIPRLLETVDFDAVKAKCVNFIKEYELGILDQWKQALNMKEEISPVIRPKPICDNNERSFLNYDQ